MGIHGVPPCILGSPLVVGVPAGQPTEPILCCCHPSVCHGDPEIVVFSGTRHALFRVAAAVAGVRLGPFLNPRQGQSRFRDNSLNCSSELHCNAMTFVYRTYICIHVEFSRCCCNDPCTCLKELALSIASCGVNYNSPNDWDCYFKSLVLLYTLQASIFKSPQCQSFHCRRPYRSLSRWRPWDAGHYFLGSGVLPRSFSLG